MAFTKTLTELEIQYSPSQFNKRMPKAEISDFSKKFTTKESQRIRNIVPCELNVSYGPTDWNKLDIYGTNLPGDAPIFVFIHGGYWQDNSKDISAVMAETLALSNIKTVLIGFALCPIVTLEQQIKEVELGVQKVLQLARMWGSRKVSLAGHSSGAHVVATLLTSFLNKKLEHGDLVKEVFLICGIYDIEPLVDTYANDCLNLTKTRAKELSPLYKNIVAENIHIFCITTEHDSPTFIKNAEEFHKKLMSTNNTAEYIRFDNMDHFDIIEQMIDGNSEISKFLRQVLSAKNI